MVYGTAAKAFKLSLQNIFLEMTRIWPQKPPEAEGWPGWKEGRKVGKRRSVAVAVGRSVGRSDDSITGRREETAVLPPASYLVFGRKKPPAAAAAVAGKAD